MRRDGRVIRQYVGSGEAGEAAAAADKDRRAAREAEREATRSTHSRLADVDAQVDALCDAAETAERACLLMAGYHRHDRGQWRRTRG
ncbi:MAG: hypothetical protein ACLQBX_16480 [Candidatus Limnocylindrales bacterium]